MGVYYIDLVFYNYILKCFLLIDLKSAQITYEDVGQMDMYIRMYDELNNRNRASKENLRFTDRQAALNRIILAIEC